MLELSKLRARQRCSRRAFGLSSCF
ncbi:hypothetical protein PENNAL_c0835G02020, partial [Penicillium nalgiovense]